MMVIVLNKPELVQEIMEELGLRLCSYGLTVCVLRGDPGEDLVRGSCDIVVEEPWMIIPFPGVFAVY